MGSGYKHRVFDGGGAFVGVVINSGNMSRGACYQERFCEAFMLSFE